MNTPREHTAAGLARAARSVGCPCQAAPGVPCGASGDHLARYLNVGQCGVIIRESLKDVIGGLDVIAPHVMIQPPGERAPGTLGTETADQAIWAQMDTGISPGRLEAPVDSVPGSRSGYLAPASGSFYRGSGEITAIRTREARELEAGG